MKQCGIVERCERGIVTLAHRIELPRAVRHIFCGPAPRHADNIWPDMINVALTDIQDSDFAWPHEPLVRTAAERVGFDRSEIEIDGAPGLCPIDMDEYIVLLLADRRTDLCKR